jgi:predicted MFS family arabinose efflux permease
VGLYLIYLPTWLETTLGVSGNEIASLFLVGGLTNIISGPMAGRMSDTVGRKPLIILSCVGFAVVMISTTFVVTSMLFAYILFGLAMLMMALRMSPLQSLLTALVSENRRGALLSLTVAIGQIGIGIGGAIAGIAYTDFGYVSNTVIGSIGIGLMAFLVYFSLPEPKADPLHVPASESERTAAHDSVTK